jgi:hypothetical protein
MSAHNHSSRSRGFITNNPPLYCLTVGWVALSGYSDWLRAGRSGDRIPVGARFFAHVQTGPGAHSATCIMGTRSFPGVESGQGVTLRPPF